MPEGQTVLPGRPPPAYWEPLPDTPTWQALVGLSLPEARARFFLGESYATIDSMRAPSFGNPLLFLRAHSFPLSVELPWPPSPAPPALRKDGGAFFSETLFHRFPGLSTEKYRPSPPGRRVPAPRRPPPPEPRSFYCSEGAFFFSSATRTAAPEERLF